jgi:hypothetical protein
MASSSSGECPCQSVISPVARNGSKDRKCLRRITTKLLVRQIGVVFNRASRFHDVNPAATCAGGSSASDVAASKVRFR